MPTIVNQFIEYSIIRTNFRKNVSSMTNLKLYRYFKRFRKQIKMVKAIWLLMILDNSLMFSLVDKIFMKLCKSESIILCHFNCNLFLKICEKWWWTNDRDDLYECWWTFRFSSNCSKCKSILLFFSNINMPKKSCFFL